jgi:hypothetical protein
MKFSKNYGGKKPLSTQIGKSRIFSLFLPQMEINKEILGLKLPFNISFFVHYHGYYVEKSVAN